MTYRTVTSWGLIAGVSVSDQRHMAPGMLCDLFVLRRRYDDEQHGVKRQQEDIDNEGVDFDNSTEPDGGTE